MIYWNVKKSSLGIETDIFRKINRLRDCKKEREYSDELIENLIEIELLKLEYGLSGEDHNDG